MPDWVAYPEFCGQSYQSRSFDLSVDRAINCYPVSNEAHTGKGGRGLFARPGSAGFSVPGGGGTGRGLWGGEGRMFAVVSGNLYEISSVGTATSLGSVGSGTAPCQMVFNGTQVMIVNPSTGILKVHDGTSMQTPTTPAGASQGAYLDGYGFIVAPNTNTVYQSALLDFLTWDGLEQASRLTEQDRIVTIKADHQYLWLVGSKTTEAWYNAGAAGFVLQRVPSSFVEQGTASAFSVVSVGGYLVMLTSTQHGSGQVMAITPGRAQRISTYAVEQAINGYGALDTAVASSYQAQGHVFYVLSFPGAAVQWVYDFTEQAWHERYSWNGSAYGMAPGYQYASTFGGQVYFQQQDGAVKLQLESLTADSGVAIRAQRVAPIVSTGKRITVNGFRLDQQIGDGSTNAGAALEVSRDGGLSYSSPITVLPGDRGASTDTKNVLEWRRLGMAKQKGLVVRVTWDNIANLAVAGAQIKVTEAAS